MEKDLILMAFDFGMKRIGSAIGQTITRSARPLITIPANEGIPDWSTLEKLIQQWQPNAFIVGIPLNMDGTEQPLTLAAKNFAVSVKTKFQLPVYEIDERLSTKAARAEVFARGGFKSLQQTEIDCVAAQLLLENWLNSN